MTKRPRWPKREQPEAAPVIVQRDYTEERLAKRLAEFKAFADKPGRDKK